MLDTDRLERLDFRLLLKVCKLILHIVYRHTAILALEPFIGLLRHALISAVPSLEENGSGPVIRKIISGLASRACRELGWVHDFWSHVWYERVAADDLVEMGGWSLAGFDERIEAVDDELGAAEADQCMAWGDERQRSEGSEEHVGQSVYHVLARIEFEMLRQQRLSFLVMLCRRMELSRTKSLGLLKVIYQVPRAAVQGYRVQVSNVQSMDGTFL